MSLEHEQPKRLTFLNRSYWPDVEATGQLLTELCEDLASNFDVTVICGQPNHNPNDDDFKRYGSATRNNVSIWRVPHTTFLKTKKRRWRMANMVSFVFFAALRLFSGKKPDTLIVETDPPLLCMLGAIYKRMRGCELVLYLQDIYPDVATSISQFPKWFPVKTIRRVFFWAYKTADVVIVLSNDMERFLIAEGVPKSRISVIPNWVDTTSVGPRKENNEFRAQHRLDDKFVVMYSGNMGLSQRLDLLIQAAEILQGNDRIQFVLVGAGATRKALEERTNESQLTNLIFLDYQPKSYLSESLSAADIQVVFLSPELKHFLMPSKLYSVLAAGTAVLAVTDTSSDLAQLVKRESVGLVADAETPEAIADAILRLYDNPGMISKMAQRARDTAVARFDRSISVSRFAHIIGHGHPIALDTKSLNRCEA